MPTNQYTSRVAKGAPLTYAELDENDRANHERYELAEAARIAAETAKTGAETAETNAAASASAAASSASAAASSATDLDAAVTAAEWHATNAAGSASAASTSETNAAASASAASTSATNAATSETNAAGSASAASTSATNAGNSATAAATSETNAGSSATAAAGSATDAADSASAAASSATAASGSATTASGHASDASDSAALAAAWAEGVEPGGVGTKSAKGHADDAAAAAASVPNINDAGAATDEVWSSQKTSVELAAHEGAADPHPGYILETEKGAANGVATLGADSKIPPAQLPAIAITEYLGESADQAAMLALVGQQGDWTIRTDLGTVWIIKGADPSLLADWQELGYPTAPVTSVAGKTGAVTLDSNDISDATADGKALLTAADKAAQRTALELETVGQAEAEAGTATTTRVWTAQRVRQAIAAWWSGVALAAANTFTGRQKFYSQTERFIDGGTGGNYTVDLSQGNVFRRQFNATATLTISNPPASDSVFFLFEAVNPGASGITLPASVKVAGGTAYEPTASGTDYLFFHSRDGGTSWVMTFLTDVKVPA